MKVIISICSIVLFVNLIWGLSANNPERPIIWVTPAERSAILQKIEEQQWAKTIYTDFINRLNAEVVRHQQNPAEFLEGMPFDREKEKPAEIPPFLLTRHFINGEYRNLDNATNAEMAPARALMRYLQTGIDCGIAYYLTSDEKYARCALDILHTFIQGVIQAELSDWQGRGGWLFPDDGFREVREIGYKVPLIYDFIAPFIRNGGKPFDFVKNSKTEFSQKNLQEVLRTYATITVHYGHTGSNHSILEAPCLVYNALAMDDENERKKWLSYFLTENTENQDALNVMAEYYRDKGDIWPETSQYLNAASSILTRLMRIVNRYDPSLRLGDRYANILFSLPAMDYFVYPNNQIIRWGDGKRYGMPPYGSYEDACLLGEMDGIAEITSEFGSLLNRAFKEGKYKRSGITSVLWYDGEYEGELGTFILPRTDQVAHAGIFLQRNPGKTDEPADGLMCFVGGAHMVHGHAEGMNIELYGCGHVLGVDNGRGSYQQDIHENYSRLFAAHNTVIVNGNSRSDSGWVNLGINTVHLVAMEPMPREDAVSPWHSFSVTSFVDDKGDRAEAYQERTLALIRTSGTTGYYVDVFRSKSTIPGEFHDYLYHNIGDQLVFLNSDLELKPTPERFMANSHLPWFQNSEYRHPGWHFFEGVETSDSYPGDVRARFTAESLGEEPVYMDVYIPGFEQREYTRVLAPPTFEAPRGYEKKTTPTLVIHKNGEAWDHPFVAVFEPFEGNNNNSISSVEKLEQYGKFKGVKVMGSVDGNGWVQYILTLEKDEVFEDKQIGIKFRGTFATITMDKSGNLQNMYMGKGTELRYGKVALIAEEEPGGAYVEWKSGKPSVTANMNHIRIIED